MRLHFFYDAMLGNEEIRLKLLTRYQEFSELIAGKIAERTENADAQYLSWLILLLSDGLFTTKRFGMMRWMWTPLSARPQSMPVS